jgi:hypothetical protein
MEIETAPPLIGLEPATRPETGLVQIVAAGCAGLRRGHRYFRLID